MSSWPPQKGRRVTGHIMGPPQVLYSDDECQWAKLRPHGYHGRAVAGTGHVMAPPEVFVLMMDAGRANPQARGQRKRSVMTTNNHWPHHGSL